MASTLSAADMDAAIIGYLPYLENEQKAAVLGIIEAFAPVPDAGDHWDDPEFVAEMDRRYEDYKSGRVKCYSLEEVMERAKAVIADVRKKKAASDS